MLSGDPAGASSVSSYITVPTVTFGGEVVGLLLTGALSGAVAGGSYVPIMVKAVYELRCHVA